MSGISYTKPSGNAGGGLNFEAQLWAAADKLRGHMDASEYKHVALGLIFLKYISDAFEEKREQLLFGFSDPKSEWFIKEEPERAKAAEDRDEYLAANVFWLPLEARWHTINAKAKSPEIGKVIDDAMGAIERENPTLKGVLPRDYARPSLDKVRLGGLVDIISNIGFNESAAKSKDVLGRVYEYFLGKFASAEGKGGGEFYTPQFRDEHFSAKRLGLPVIKIGELKGGITPQTKFSEVEREPKYRINSGDILFSWSGSPDTSIDIFIWTEGEGWLNQHIFKVEFKRPVEKYFVYYLLRHLKPVFIEIARDKQTTGLGHVTGQDLKRLKTIFPPDDILQKFNRVAEPLFQKFYSNLHESRTLATLRDALLPKLLSGELRVPVAKRLAEMISG
jgi:type I restriction enzyme M protein